MKPYTLLTNEATPSSLRRIALLTVLLCTISLLAAQFITHSRSRAQQLSLADRIAAQRAIEQVYWQHRIWPKDNPQPKPALDEVLPAAALQAKVEESLRQSAALAQIWQRPVTAADVQAELDRMARDTKQPAVLRELWAALNNDPLLIAECLARPALVERRVREQYEADGAAALAAGATEAQRASFEEWWQQVRAGLPLNAAAAGSDYHLSVIAEAAVACGSEEWKIISTTGAPSIRGEHTVVWTGSELIVWGGVVNSSLDSGGRYNPATDSWISTSTTGAPSARNLHTAIWTGTEMIVWGGEECCFFPRRTLNTGGRYNPATNTWVSTSGTNVPTGRFEHTAVWTGSEVIIWGGWDSGFNFFNTGGRYNPVTNTWTATDMSGSPTGRIPYNSVWTGSEMIIWGGFGISANRYKTGGRYNPVTNSWTATSTTGAPSERNAHAAVWTGNEMIVWGGYDGLNELSTGGRYNPATDVWITTNPIGAPNGRSLPTVVWAGSEMIVFGSVNGSNTGRRYNPTTNAWTAAANSPSGLGGRNAVWTGSEMIYWNYGAGSRYLFAPALTLSQTSQSFTASSGTGNIAVTAQGDCTWSATSNANWITLTGSTTGSGNGTVNFSVAANTGAVRTGTITISGQQLTITQAAPLPLLVASVNGASYAANAPLVPDSIVSAFGENLSTSETGQGAPPGTLPTTLAGTTVKIKDSAGVEHLAPLFFVAKMQVNYLLPTAAALGAATVTITNGAGVMSVGTIQIALVAPGIFSANADGKGLVIGSAIRVKNGVIVGEEQLVRYDETQRKFVAIPLEVGNSDERVILQLYGTGFRHRSSLANVVVTIGGVAATVEYAGAQPSFVGLDQLNVVVPPSLAGRGEVEIRVTVDGILANIVTIHIR